MKAKEKVLSLRRSNDELREGNPPALTMTGRERLLSAIRHKEPDRVPVSPRIFAWLLAYYGECTFETYMRSVEEFGYDAFWSEFCPTPNYIFTVAESYELPNVDVEQEKEPCGDCVRVRRRFHTPAGELTDITIVPPAGSHYGISPNPIKLEHLVKAPKDLSALRYLIPPIVRDLGGFFEREAKVGDRGLAELAFYSPIDHNAGSARGVERMMLDYYDDRGFLKEHLNIFHQHTLEQIKVALEAEVKVIFVTWYWASLSVGWSRRHYEELFLPLLAEQIELVHGHGALYHYYDDGKCMNIIPLLKEAGVDIFSTCTPPPVGDFDLAEAKRSVGERICLKGYIDLLYVVKRGTPQLIRETVRRAMELGKPDGGFILGSSDSFRDGTPFENVKAYFDSAREFGEY